MTSQDWAEILKEEPENELVRFSYAKALMDEKRWGDAALEFSALTHHEPDYAIAWAFLARCLLRAGDRSGAQRACDLGMPAAQKLGHEVPIEELEAVLDELNSEF